MKVIQVTLKLYYSALFSLFLLLLLYKEIVFEIKTRVKAPEKQKQKYIVFLFKVSELNTLFFIQRKKKKKHISQEIKFLCYVKQKQQKNHDSR